MADKFTLTPADLDEMLSDPEFQALPFEQRSDLTERGIGHVSEYLSANGGWTKDRWQQFGTLAKQTRDDLKDSETVMEKAGHYAGVAGQTIKDLPAIIGTGVAGLSPAIPDGKGGWTGQVPLETLGPALGRNLVGLAASTAAMFSDAEKPVVEQLDTLRKEIDDGVFLDHKDGFNGWIDEKQRAVQDAQKSFYGEGNDWHEQNSILGDENLKLVQGYLASRSPSAWDALQKNILRTPFRAKLQGDKTALENETKLGQALVPEARGLISEAADPAEVFPGMLAVKKGVESVAKGVSVGRRALEVGKGVAGEMAGEQVSATIDDPYLSAADRWRVAKDSLAGSLGLLGVGGAAKVAADLATGTKAPAPAATLSSNETVPTPEAAAEAAPEIAGPTPEQLARPEVEVVPVPPEEVARARNAAFQQQAQEAPAAVVVAGEEEHVSDLTEADVVDLEEDQNMYAGRRFPLPAGLADAAALVRPPMPAPAQDLAAAYSVARQGASTAFLPLGAVYEQARQSMPELTPETFLEQVRQGYESGQVMLEGANSEVEVQQAGGFALPGTPVGTGVRMALQENLFQGGNQFANPGDPSLSRELMPGSLPGDVKPGTDPSPAEAAQLVRDWGRTLPAHVLPAGRQLAPAAAAAPDARADSLAFAKAFAGIFRRRIVVVDGLAPDKPGGATNPQFPDTVFLNAKAARHWHSLAGHEMVHHLEMSHPDLFDRLDKVLSPQVKNLDAAQSTYASYNYQGLGRFHNADRNVRREIYADLMGDSMSDPEFWTALGQAEPGIFMPMARAVWQWFKDVMNALKRRGWESSQYFREVEAAQKALREAMVEFARRENGLQPQQAEAVIKDILSGDNFFQGLNAPVAAAEVMGPGKRALTRSRFARPDEAEQAYETRADRVVKSEAEAWLDGKSLATAIDLLGGTELPAGIFSEDIKQQAIGQALRRAMGLMDQGDEFARTNARILANKASRLYQDAGREAARSMRQRAVVNHALVPYAPILAAENLLIDRADSVMNKRFTGGAKGGAAKTGEVARKSGQKAGEAVAKKISGPRTPRAQQEVDEAAVREAAENRASQLIYQVEERLRQGSKDLKGAAAGGDTINRAFREQVTDPLPWASFAARLGKLKVGEDVAARLFKTAEREAQDRDAMAVYRAEKARVERAERQASQLIYKTEERLRQGSKDTQRSRDGDSINQAFRDQVEQPLDLAAFRARLSALGVPPALIDRLFKTAEREAQDRAKMQQFEDEQAARELAKNEPALARLLNELRRKMYPGMNWQAIFEELPGQQRERQRVIYERLRKDERLRGLTPAERVKLTNELDKAWQRERRKIFLRELEKAGALGEKATVDREKAKKAAPRLLRAINLGLMTSETFREAIAPEYGLKMLSQADAAKLRGMAEEAYQIVPGVLRSRKLKEMVEFIQKKTRGTWVEIMDSYWTAAVLSSLRTLYDTFMAVTNGLGTNLIQAGMLGARGKFTAAKEVHQEWWRGLGEGAKESLRILATGDRTFTKRFNEDMMRALDGESGVAVVPLSEQLWRESNFFTKAPVAVMLLVGRAMTAADHMNNTATTRGAMAVARALSPEIYAERAGWTTEERNMAREQALREMTGGVDDSGLGKDEKAILSTRAREILYDGISPETRVEASEIGDEAAYQTDPTGVFGLMHKILKGALGTGARLLGDVEKDQVVNRWVSVLAGAAAGSIYAVTGTRFMRFGFNFGADMTRYVPGMYIAGLAGFYGRETSQQQRDLLLGKNIVGLLGASMLASMFVGKDDEDEGWHQEGAWSNLTDQQKKERRAAGFEPLSFWKRDERGNITRLYYKQWPLMGIMAAVGGMQDEFRFDRQKFEERGVTGHLGKAFLTGLVQIQNVSAMRNVGELFAGGYGSTPEDTLLAKMEKTAANWATGFVPRILKDAEAWFDSQIYKPEGVWESFLADIPMVRQSVGGGRPQLNVLGEPIELNRAPWSRMVTTVQTGPEMRMLAQLMTRGVSLPGASDKKMVYRDGEKQTLESMGGEVAWKYQKYVGQGYAELLRNEGRTLLGMAPDQAQKTLNRLAERVKSVAMMRVMQGVK